MLRKLTFCTALVAGSISIPAARAIELVQPELVAPVRPGEQTPSMQPANAPPRPGGEVRLQAPRPMIVQSHEAAPHALLASGCEACESCDSGCSTYNYGGWTLDNCSLGEAWALEDCLTPCCDTTNYGGWVSIGYHNNFERLSDENTQGLSFNDRPDNLNLHQAWLYFERVANGDDGCADWGYRFDIMYGLDAQKTQSYGNPRAFTPNQGRWDASLDHGAYGWAMPQAYLEYAQGDLRVKAGHFYTPLGYEVVQATGNFFYSHSLTFFNSEPFTHTGMLATYKVSDGVTLYGGWTLGWDTGFDQFGGGSNFLGGFSATVAEDVTYTYLATAGDLGWRGEGYSHSNVLNFKLSDCLTYILQSDYVNANTPAAFDNEDLGINQYLIYKLNDRWSLGSRMEWWKSNNPTGAAASYYELTGGINYRPHANLVIRPEVRYDWTPSNQAYEGLFGVDYNQFVFGIDAVLSF